MKRLLEVGYGGLIVEDHYPVLAGDTNTQDGAFHGHRARAHAFGYLQALLQGRATLSHLTHGADPHAPDDLFP